MSSELMVPSNHLIYRPLLLLSSIFPRIKVIGYRVNFYYDDGSQVYASQNWILRICSVIWASLRVQLVKNVPAMQETLIPWLGRSAGEGIGYPLQYSWASFVTQLVKNAPAMWETWVAIVNNTVQCTFNYVKRINLMPGDLPNIPCTITQ